VLRFFLHVLTLQEFVRINVAWCSKGILKLYVQTKFSEVAREKTTPKVSLNHPVRPEPNSLFREPGVAFNPLCGWGSFLVGASPVQAAQRHARPPACTHTGANYNHGLQQWKWVKVREARAAAGRRDGSCGREQMTAGEVSAV
jgi:hypothetical protein